VHNFFLNMFIAFSTCFGQLCAYHQKNTVHVRHLVFFALKQVTSLKLQGFMS